jgi:hypothetical protein
MVEVIDPKFCKLSSKSSDGYFSRHPSRQEVMARRIHAFLTTQGGPRETVTCRAACVPRPPKQNKPMTSRYTRLSVSITAHYSLKNLLGIFPIVLLLEEIMAR